MSRRRLFVESGDPIIVEIPIKGQRFEVRGVASVRWLAGERVQKLVVDQATATAVEPDDPDD